MVCDCNHMCPHMYLFRCAIVACAKPYKTSKLHANICNFMLSEVSICRNPLYYIVFENKHIGVWEAQKHFKQV